MNKPERFALCGGTYDPIHRGHVEPVMRVFEPTGWSRVFFIPAFQQPFKADRLMASPYHRFAMAVLATEDDPRIEVTPIELERGRVTYTVETLEAFRESYPGAILDWVIGDDNLEELGAWRSIERILQLANFAVLKRTGKSSLSPELRTRVRPLAEHPASGAILFLDNPIVPVSATDIRRRLAAGQDVSALVHPSVDAHIRRHRLYQRDLGSRIPDHGSTSISEDPRSAIRDPRSTPR